MSSFLKNNPKILKQNMNENGNFVQITNQLKPIPSQGGENEWMSCYVKNDRIEAEENRIPCVPYLVNRYPAKRAIYQ